MEPKHIDMQTPNGTQLNLDALYQIRHVVLESFGALGVVELEPGQVAGIAVITHNFARTVNDGNAQVHHFRHANGLQCDLYSDAVSVTDSNAHLQLFIVVVFTHSLIMMSIMMVEYKNAKLQQKIGNVANLETVFCFMNLSRKI